MRDPLLDELRKLFDETDPAPAVREPRPTGFRAMLPVLEPMRGVEQQLNFQRGAIKVHLQVDDGRRLIGIVPANTAVRVQQHDTSDLRADDLGWFRADVVPGPVCVSLPELDLTTGWFVA